MKSYEMPYESAAFGWHYRKILINAVRLAELKGKEAVLDFGCEHRALRKHLPAGVKYVGYDIVPELSDVRDYRKLKGIDVVFCLNVLDHLQERQLKELLGSLKRMKVKRLVVAMSNNNLLNRLLEFVFGYDEQNMFTHFLTAREIGHFLVKEFGFPLRMKRVDGVQYLASFKVK